MTGSSNYGSNETFHQKKLNGNSSTSLRHYRKTINLVCSIPGQRFLSLRKSKVSFGFLVSSSTSIRANSEDRYFEGSSRFLKAITPPPNDSFNLYSWLPPL